MNKPIIYQLLVRHFGNTNTQNKLFGSIEENGCGKFNHINDKALIALKDFGINHIWLTGILEHATCTDYSQFGIKQDNPATVKGRAGSPYAVKDYFDVDPDLAEDIPQRFNEFEALLGRIHNHELKAIIDFIPNHVARQYFSDQKPKHITNLGEKDDKTLAFSPQNNFYYIPDQKLQLPDEIYKLPYLSPENQVYHESPAKVTGNDSFSAHPAFTDWYETVKLNYGIDYTNGGRSFFDPIPSTWLRMEEILLFWASKKVDGFRCDMAEMVPLDFWKWLIPRIKKQYPEIVFIAEIYNPSRYHEFIHIAGFDFLYDKEGLYNVLRDVITSPRPASAIPDIIDQLYQFNKHLLRFIENHDEQRLASSFFASSPQAGFPASAISALAGNGPFMIYCGQETGEKAIGASGFSGDDGRTSIFDYCSIPQHVRWANKLNFDGLQLDQESLSLREHYKLLLNLIHDEPLFSNGQYYNLLWNNPPSDIFPSNKIFPFLRYSDTKVFLVIASLQNSDVSISLKIPEHAFNTIPLLNFPSFSLNEILDQYPALVVQSHDWMNHGQQFFLGAYDTKILEIKGIS